MSSAYFPRKKTMEETGNLLRFLGECAMLTVTITRKGVRGWNSMTFMMKTGF